MKIFFLKTIFFFLLHPYFVSVFDLNYNASDKTVEITIKSFKDDFEKTLQKNFNAKIDLSDTTQKNNIDSFINLYVHRSFKLKLNNKNYNYSYLGFEIEKESIRTYWQIENIQSVKKIEIWQNYLYDLAPEQINIFNITGWLHEDHFKMSNPERTKLIEF
ncbi:MAG: hypothetical protein ORN85_10600 [Sediminibacterium sp.]|nr:hypothetical protein [Sediminibacterium sp.]